MVSVGATSAKIMVAPRTAQGLIKSTLHGYDTRTPAAETVSLTALAALPAKLFVVELLDRLHRGLELVPVDADHDENAQEERVHVGVRKQALGNHSEK